MRPEITVGLTTSAAGDLRGDTDRVLQAAVNHVAALGGGTVRLGPGEWLLRNSVVLRTGVSLVGAGEKTVLRKAPGGTSLLAEDGDYGDNRLLPQDSSSFQVGDGLTVRSNRFAGFFSTVATVVGKEGDGALLLDDRMNADLMVADGAAVSHACPLLRATDQQDVQVRDLVLDGNREQCPPEDGCRGGAVNLLRVARVVLSGLTCRNMNGDGFSYQNCPDVLVERCLCEDNAGGGCHPGSGSARPIVRDCVLRRNGGCGLFLCWRVKNGLFEGNTMEENAQMGISIGHKDTDNRFVRNTVRRNKLSGVYFREEAGHAAGHRCTVEDCLIEDNGGGGEHGGAPAAGIRIDGETNDTVLRRNTVRGTTVALLIGPKAGPVTVEGELSGEVRDLRPRR